MPSASISASASAISMSKRVAARRRLGLAVAALVVAQHAVRRREVLRLLVPHREDRSRASSRARATAHRSGPRPRIVDADAVGFGLHGGQAHRFADRRLEGQPHIPREVDPGVLRHLGDEGVDQRPAHRLGIDGREMRLRAGCRARSARSCRCRRGHRRSARPCPSPPPILVIDVARRPSARSSSPCVL